MKEGWEYKKLGEVADVAAGQGAPQGDSNYCSDGIPFIKAGNLESLINGMSEHKVQNVSDVVAKSHRLKLYKAGSVLFAKSGMSCMKGWVYTLKHDCYVVSHLAIITPHKQKIESRYLNYYFQFYKPNTLVKDAAYPSISLKDIENMPLLTPPLSEQQHIVEELDLLNSIIEKKKAQLNELDKLAQSLFYEMFGDPITNEKGWSYKKLNTLIDENVITYHLDGNHGGDYPRSEEFVDEGVPYIGANSLNNGFVNFSMAKYLPKERAAKLKKGLAINGDVLFAHNATVGPVAYLITNEPSVILSTSLTAYRCNQDKMNPLFLRAYMQSIWFESQYKASMKQTTRNQIPITQQKKFDFILPPISLQNQFAEKVQAIEHQKDLIKQSIKEVETLFNSRMDYYFN